MGAPEIVLVVMPGNGGRGLIVNDTVVLTTFSSRFGDQPVVVSGDVEEVATKLAESLGVALHTVSMDVPLDDDWNWDDVVELLPPRETASTTCQPG